MTAVVIMVLVMAALIGAVTWTIWDMVAEAREERLARARLRRSVDQAEYKLHQKSSEAFHNMMQVARDQSSGEFQEHH